MTRSTASATRRSDARRSAEALLGAAKQIFAEAGVDAPARQITDRAGVGVGTLYRHFPLRSDLIVAVLEGELADCTAAAGQLTDAADPMAAVDEWIGHYTELVRTKQGLAAALHSGDPAYAGLPQRVFADLEPAFAQLFDRAVVQGRVRSGIGARDVLLGIALLCQPVPGEPGDLAPRLVQNFVDGLRIR